MILEATWQTLRSTLDMIRVPCFSFRLQEIDVTTQNILNNETQLRTKEFFLSSRTINEQSIFSTFFNKQSFLIPKALGLNPFNISEHNLRIYFLIQCAIQPAATLQFSHKKIYDTINQGVFIICCIILCIYSVNLT